MEKWFILYNQYVNIGMDKPSNDFHGKWVLLNVTHQTCII